MRPHSSTGDVERLVLRAMDGDRTAWQDLVRRYSRLIWAVARAHRLPNADAMDVCQATWLRLTERLASLREPKKLPGWLMTTARRESLRMVALRRREQTWEEHPAEPRQADRPMEETPENVVLLAEQDRALWQAFNRLPARCRRLLRAMAFHPDWTYAQVGEAMNMPANSVGPTRNRCLARLRALVGPATARSARSSESAAGGRVPHRDAAAPGDAGEGRPGLVRHDDPAPAPDAARTAVGLGAPGPGSGPVAPDTVRSE
ncbi:MULTISPECIES: RNA polymerase sigma factor [Actinoalloteichus]|uniref:RNA polymerase sigma factor, sigma-70 family n=1 Tax=Actinoalloteichus fjordicus TaxID=1612552 RepID=A0AAC9LJ58_9PSEU|nr:MULTISPECIES: sigma-70 family RNA polymerase sigma factor [Actinoalloteichus]APU17724.1 RNA polymerase sigma factor, sigma-70 family [Actinoalloteichus fjordicus]APU23802.1 RNA polymerase sigma factor, sigma-70 family [Actinoalloteichus sp. GBA129-24]